MAIWELGFEFTEEHNERLKGVSRMRSLDILLAVGGREFGEAEKLAMAEKKNRLYVEYISGLDESELLPGVRAYLSALRARGVAIALGSASKNAEFILDKLNIAGLFDVVIDGNKVAAGKAAGMQVVGIGKPEVLKAADLVISGLHEL